MINMRLPLWNRIVTQATDSQPGGKVWLQRPEKLAFGPLRKNVQSVAEQFVVIVDEETSIDVLGQGQGSKRRLS